MASILSSIRITPAWVPIADLDAAATTGLWIDCRGYASAAFLLWKNDAAANVVTVTFNRAAASDGTGTELFDVLSTAATNRTIWSKTGTSDALIGAAGAWTRVAAASSSTYATTAASPGFVVVEFDLDQIFTAATVANNRWIQASASDPGSAQIGIGLWLLHGPRYGNPLLSSMP